MAVRPFRGTLLMSLVLAVIVVIAVVVPDRPVALTSSETTAPACDPVGHRTQSDCIRHRHIGVAGFGHVLPDKQFTLQISLHPSLDDKTVAVDVDVRSAIPGRATSWRSTRVYTGTGGSFARSGGWRTVSVRAPGQTGLYEVRTHVTWANVRPLAVLTAAVSGAGGSAPTSAVSESSVLSVGNCGSSSQDAALVAYLNGTYEGGPAVNPETGQLWSGSSTNPISVTFGVGQGGWSMTFACAEPGPNRYSFQLDTPFGNTFCNTGPILVTDQELQNLWLQAPYDGCSMAPSSVCNMELYVTGPGGPLLDEIALPIEGPTYPSNATTVVPTLDLATMRCD
jgi:hypothetical protein